MICCEYNRHVSLWWTRTGWEVRTPVQTIRLGCISVEEAVKQFDAATNDYRNTLTVLVA